ncbi:MAG: hypothetical protein R2942_17245 [Ignavibacteria bacterium]
MEKAETLVNENLSPGSYEFNWNAGNLAGGIYYYTLTSGNFTDEKNDTYWVSILSIGNE